MKTRNEILSDGMLRQAHPKLKPLSYGRWIILDKIRDEMVTAGNSCGHTLTAIRWVVCTREPDDAELVAALASSDRVDAFRPLWDGKLHISDVPAFTDWWEAEITGQEAAATVHKPETRPGKSEPQEEQIPTT